MSRTPSSSSATSGSESPRPMPSNAASATTSEAAGSANSTRAGSIFSRRSKPRRLLMAGAAAGALALVAGCGGSSASDGPDWAALCSGVDVQAITTAADQFSAAELQVSETTDPAQAEAALVGVLRAGSGLFGTMSQELGPLFTAASQEAGDPALAETSTQLQTASEGFNQLATDVETNGFTEETQAKFDALSTQLNSLDSLNTDFDTLDAELSNVSECVQLSEDLDQIDSTIN